MSELAYRGEDSWVQERKRTVERTRQILWEAIDAKGPVSGELVKELAGYIRFAVEHGLKPGLVEKAAPDPAIEHGWPTIKGVAEAILQALAAESAGTGTVAGPDSNLA